MPIRSNIDSEGFPYRYVENSCRTILFVKGDEQAVAKAVKIAKANEGKARNSYDEFTINKLGPYTVIDITINDEIPSDYDEIVALEGIDEVIYIIYSEEAGRIITNDREQIFTSHRRELKLPENYEIEVDDDSLYPTGDDSITIGLVE